MRMLPDFRGKFNSLRLTDLRYLLVTKIGFSNLLDCTIHKTTNYNTYLGSGIQHLAPPKPKNSPKSNGYSRSQQG